MLTDASRLHGICFALVQVYDRLTLIQCGSASLSPAQSRYSTVELECLAIVHAIYKCRYYLASIRSQTSGRRLHKTPTSATKSTAHEDERKINGIQLLSSGPLERVIISPMPCHVHQYSAPATCPLSLNTLRGASASLTRRSRRWIQC